MFVLNYDPVEREVTLHKPAKDMLSGDAVSGRIRVEPYGVRIFQIG